MAKIHFSTKDILKKTFKNKMRGYDPTDVDSFLDMIIEDYRTFESTTTDMKNQIDSLMAENRKLQNKLVAYQNSGQRPVVPQQPANDQPSNTNNSIEQESNIAGFDKELSRSPRYLRLVREVNQLKQQVFGN